MYNGSISSNPGWLMKFLLDFMTPAPVASGKTLSSF